MSMNHIVISPSRRRRRLQCRREVGDDAALTATTSRKRAGGDFRIFLLHLFLFDVYKSKISKYFEKRQQQQKKTTSNKIKSGCIFNLVVSQLLVKRPLSCWTLLFLSACAWMKTRRKFASAMMRQYSLSRWSTLKRPRITFPAISLTLTRPSGTPSTSKQHDRAASNRNVRSASNSNNKSYKWTSTHW